MSTDLSNGVIIPEEYSDDWYDEMSINLRKLNDVITAASDNATDIQRLDTDKANQSDLTALTSRVSQNETDIIALQTAVSGALKREIVQTLPTEDISTTTIYMIRNSQSSGTNIYDEYMYINSQWELIGTSATDFSNYYTKNETDNLLSAKANQTDLTSLSGRVTQNETDITALQTAVSGALKREIVQSLPTQDISTTTIYMIRNTTTSGDNIYDEYMYINSQWELIGTSATDFSNYYTKNETDNLLSSKANDSGVMHLSGNESASGDKNFKGLITTVPDESLWPEVSNTTADITLLGNNVIHIEYRTSGKLTDLSGGSWNVVELGVGCLFFRLNNGTDIRYKHLSQNTVNRIPVVSGANRFINDVTPNQDNTFDLGSSSLRWRSINGINPGALSLPNLSNGIDISAYISVTGGQNILSTYTAPADGWISINLGRASGAMALLISNGSCSVNGRDVTFPDAHRECSGILQVFKNDTVTILSNLADSVLWAYFYPCMGNV